MPEAGRWWLGFDIGGTRTKAGIVTDDGAVSQAHVKHTDHQPFERVWAHLMEHVHEAIASADRSSLAGIGIAAPGVVEPGFGVRNLPQENLEPFLLIECPRLLFPFARRIIADATRDGGFPPLLLDPIDFTALYQKHRQELQAQQAESGEAPVN